MNRFKEIYIKIRDEIFDAIDVGSLAESSRMELSQQLMSSVNLLIESRDLQVSNQQRQNLVNALVDELKGLGPLQALVNNDDISDIMINGPFNVFIEINGKVEKSPVQFINEEQLITIAKRIDSEDGHRSDATKNH